MAIFHLDHRPIGKATHRAGYAAAHVRYILRGRAATQVLGDLPGAKLTRTDAARWLSEREQKMRANGRVADRVVLALPLEIDAVGRAATVAAFVHELDPAGRIAWVAAVHDRGEDAANPHAHVMLVDADRETGKRVLMMSERGSTERVRAAWETVANRALEREGVDARIDRRSLEAQGIDRIPTIHIGPEMQRPRVEAERRELAAEIAAGNELIAEARAAEEEAAAAKSHVDDLRDELGVARLRARYPGIPILEDVVEGVRGTLEAVEEGGRFVLLAIRRGLEYVAVGVGRGLATWALEHLGLEIAIDRATDESGEPTVAVLDDGALRDVEPARAAGEAIGSRSTGVIERVDERFVYQRVDGELVAHRRAAFGNDRADELELAIRGREPQEIDYEYDGPTLGPARAIEPDLPDF